MSTNKFNIFLNFPDKIIDYSKDPDSLENFYSEFKKTIDRADCEKESLLYYEEDNCNNFLGSCELIKEEFNGIGTANFADLISYFIYELEIIKINNELSIKEDKCVYKEWDTDVKNSKDTILLLKEIAERKSKTDNPLFHFLIININKIDYYSNPISIIKDCRDKEPIFIYIDFITNFNELDNWFLKNRIARSYNLTDNRHIEDAPGSQIKSHNKSPLIGGLGGKTNAESLLTNAVGDKKETKDLINYDVANESFIWFEYENESPQNQYHGYHLVRRDATVYINDNKAEEKIPERVIQILKNRGIII